MSNVTGRRAAGRPKRGPKRWWSPLALAVVVVPLIVAGGLGTLKPPPVPLIEPAQPTQHPLTSLDLSCPTPPTEDATLLVAQAAVSAEDGGDVDSPPAGITFGLGGVKGPLELAGEALVESPSTEAGVIAALGSAAPGLVGTVASSGQPAIAHCVEPSPSQWFGGLGAGPTHGSEVELINPDLANAVADITVFSEQGIVDVPELRGVAVPAESHLILKLAELLPQRGQLALEVTVSRGRLGVHVLDRSDELGKGDVSADWSPPQAEPAMLNVLLGLPAGTGQHKLVVTNPGQDVALVSLRVTTAEAAFAPAGLAEVQIPPESVAVVAVSDAVNEAVADAGLGLLVESSQPVTAVLRSITDGDLSFTGSSPTITQGLALVPNQKDPKDTDPKDTDPKTTGGASVVLSGGPNETTGTIRFLDQQGGTLGEETFTVAALASATVTLPSKTRIVNIDSVVGVSAALLVTTKSGTAVGGVLPLLTATLVPDVRPAVR